jgi:3-oxoacyl-[acyl-carrier protein] reductase
VINYTKSEAEAKETLQACEAAGGEAILVQADVSQDADCIRLAKAAVDRWGRIDNLINNAGTTKFVPPGELDGLTPEDFQKIFSVNVTGIFLMTRACVPAMRKAGRGAVVNISSVASILGSGSSIAYAASKGAVNTLTKALARSLGPEIRVNAVLPGFIEGRWLLQGYGQQTYDNLKRRYQTTTPLGKTATPDDVAEACVWLLEGGPLTTGELISVDSGMHMGPIR